MKKIHHSILVSHIAFSILFSIPVISHASDQPVEVKTALVAQATPKIFEVAKKNTNWKVAYYTGKNAQVVFMNISPTTNPKNEIGLETHPFDQVIFIVEGQAKAILNNRNSIVKTGDMVFIPQGIPHNFINLSATKPFKIISIYSNTDIPDGASYKTVSDTPAND